MIARSVEIVSPATGKRAATLLNAVTQIAVWADTIGQSLEPDNLFHPETIERFVFESVGHLAPGTQTNYRSQLRRVAMAVVGSTLYSTDRNHSSAEPTAPLTALPRSAPSSPGRQGCRPSTSAGTPLLS